MRAAALASAVVLGGLLGGLIEGPAAHASPGRSPAGQLATVEIPPQPHATSAGVLFLNRCAGGCTITKGGINDARSNVSTIPDGPETTYTVNPFAWGDTEWNDIVQCMREVYSPYAVDVVDVEPTDGRAYNEAIIAGSPSEVGRSGIGGIAPVTSDCTPYSYVISYTFSNIYGPNGRVFDLCAVAAQESGHSFGLDHTYEFLDGTSGCRDPMSYRGDCGGQRFFRNDLAYCGEFSRRQSCRCGTTQQSHLTLLQVLGEGTPITRPPTVTLDQPAAGAAISAGQVVTATAGAQRGIRSVELWINGYLWGTARGAAWGATGQPTTAYGIPLPADVPDGVLDIVVTAKDDLDVATSTPTITVTKGAPCATADSCLAGQRCDAGRCLWDPATGELGDPCSFPQACTSGLCAGPEGDQICSRACVPGAVDSCGDTLVCEATGVGQGVCLQGGAGECEGGCCGCSLTTPGTDPQGPLLLVGATLLVAWPRRRRRGAAAARPPL